MTSDQFNHFFATLANMYPDATTELQYETPFQLLMAVILSAQTTDKQVNKATKKLFDHIRRPQDILTHYTIETLPGRLRSINYYKSKSAHLYLTAKKLADEKYQTHLQKTCTLPQAHKLYKTHEYYIPDTKEELTGLRGVGEKTANVVLHTLYDLPLIAVDTHVHRVANRLGIVTTKTPNQTSQQLHKILPDTFLTHAHHRIVLFGRYHCTARRPKCQHCPFLSYCRYSSGVK